MALAGTSHMVLTAYELQERTKDNVPPHREKDEGSR